MILTKNLLEHGNINHNGQLHSIQVKLKAGCTITISARPVKMTLIMPQKYLRDQLMKSSKHTKSKDDIFNSQ